MGDRKGFTLVEIVVALAIIAGGLLLLLATIRQGLKHLEVCRAEFQSCLEMQTTASLFSCGIGLPFEDNNWTVKESELRPGVKVLRLTQGSGGAERVLWVSQLEPKPEEPPPAE